MCRKVALSSALVLRGMLARCRRRWTLYQSRRGVTELVCAADPLHEVDSLYPFLGCGRRL